jgi:hypothetical protein
MDGQDLILWDTELNAVLTEGELLAWKTKKLINC